MEDQNLVVELSDEDEDEVMRTIALQKRLILESQSLNTHIVAVELNSLPHDTDGADNLKNEDVTAATSEDQETAYCNALAANLEYDSYLARLETNLKTLIAECKTNLDDLSSVREGQKKAKKRASYFGRGNHVYVFGAPFFKDQHYYPSPPNADTVSKIQNNELCWIDLPPVRWWKPGQTKKLVDAIKEHAKQACEKDALNEKNALIRRYNSAKEDSEEKGKLEEELEGFSKDNYVSSHLNEKIATMDHDWMSLSASVLNGKHSEDECCGFWYNYLHPKFYKGNWDQAEDSKLRSLAEKHKYQDWDQIAQELGTGRSGYQCFAQYQSEVVEVSKQKWTEAEDEQLKALVEKFRIGDFIPWGQVTMHMKGRSKTQVYNRWTYSLNPKIKKGRFTIQEDIIILRGVQKWGEDFQKIASYMPDRMAPQIRIRYHAGISKSDFKPWTREEDVLLLGLVRQRGHNWAQLCKHFPGKSSHKIRHRYDTISRWMKANPGKPIQEISSRRTTRLDVYDAHPEMWAYAEKLLSGENPTTLSTSLLAPLAPPPKSKRSAGKLSLIDEKLAEYFQGTYAQPSAFVRKFTSLPECGPKLISEVAAFLSILGAKLSIPSDACLDKDRSLDDEDRQVLRALRVGHPGVVESEVPPPAFEHVSVDDVDRSDDTAFHFDYDINVNIDYLEPSDPSSTQVDMPHSFTGPFPRSWTRSAPPVSEPEPEAPPATPDHPLFGNLKYLCPPNYSTLVGLRSILLGKRKLVESISNFATDPVLAGDDDGKSAAFQRASQLWDDRLMCLFALANMLSKTKHQELGDADESILPGPSDFGSVVETDPVSGSVHECAEMVPGPSTSDVFDVGRTMISGDGTVRVLTAGQAKRKTKRKKAFNAPRKRQRKS